MADPRSEADVPEGGELPAEGEPPETREAPEAAGSGELERRLREAGEEELLALVREHAGRLDPPAVRQVLLNPYVTGEVIERVAAESRLLSFHEVRRGLALHPRTPEALAARFVPGLYWRELATLSLDTRLHPRRRRAAEQRLAARVPELSVGEKVAIARRASSGVLSMLRQDPSPRVIAALLDNPRLTEGLLAPVVHNPATPSPVLETIAADRRWGWRQSLRVALAKNPSTPLATAWRLLGTLRRDDLRTVACDPRIAEPLRRRARVLLEER
jgi:hypothetical protein